MSNIDKKRNQKTPAAYRIQVEGILDKKWSEWFEGMVFTYDRNCTFLTGSVADQTALHGLLNRIRDLNLTLIRVERLDDGLENPQ